MARFRVLIDEDKVDMLMALSKKHNLNAYKVLNEIINHKDFEKLLIEISKKNKN